MKRRMFIQSLGAGTTGFLLSNTIKNGQAQNRKPNIVFILIDDMGWADVGCNGSTYHETPNIDRLAKEGMRFTDGYAACPVCSPTRASIMTGKYPARLHLTNFLVGKRSRKDSPVIPPEYEHQLPLSEVTIAERLKEAGYTTCHIGKWHLGDTGFYPEDQGFDINIAGSRSGMPQSFFWPQWKGNPPIEGHKEGEYLPDRLANEAVNFITQHKDHPFFLYLSHYSVHIPLEAKEEMIQNYKDKGLPEYGQNNPVYAAMVESIDHSVGKVMNALRENGLEEDTLVVFTSDNGGLSVQEGKHTPATSNAPLREGKGYLYEGGIREPMIVKYPKWIKAGSTCTEPVTSVDYFPTILEIAGLKPTAEDDLVDGESIVPLLSQTGKIDRDAIYWHYPHFANQGGRPGGAVREGDYKLIERYEDGTLELFNVRDDISETKDLAFAMPRKTKTLQAKLHRWLKEVDAQMMLPNPAYSKKKMD